MEIFLFERSSGIILIRTNQRFSYGFRLFNRIGFFKGFFFFLHDLSKNYQVILNQELMIINREDQTKIITIGTQRIIYRIWIKLFFNLNVLVFNEKKKVNFSRFYERTIFFRKNSSKFFFNFFVLEKRKAFLKFCLQVQKVFVRISSQFEL